MVEKDTPILDATKDELDRFWSKVRKGRREDDCWEWVAAKIPRGYGQFWYRYSQFGAHRFSYTIAYGLIPDGLVVDHKCVNPCCVRPEHLQVVTVAENSKLNDRGARRKRVCKAGHLLDESNIYYHSKSGKRDCKECRRRRVRESHARKVAQRDPIDREARTEAAFWAKIDKDDGECWLWNGSVEGGPMKFGWMGKTIVPSRLLFERKHGKLGKQRIKNVCGDRLCVNPDHWEKVRRAEAIC